MSKASEWFRMASTRPAISINHERDHRRDMRISLTDDSDVRIYVGSSGDVIPCPQIISGDQAVKMAHWILDTFGETQ